MNSITVKLDICCIGRISAIVKLLQQNFSHYMTYQLPCQRKFRFYKCPLLQWRKFRHSMTLIFATLAGFPPLYNC